jgi:hypothetical protein
MSQQVLRDKTGNRIGTIDTDSSGKMIGRDKTGNRVGEYDPKSNITRDKTGNRLGTGNLLASLITDALH